ncbi:polyketide synthase dehydratase domain-containing protein, partial [Saccharomonospora iraqiensis]|uniref:polyketide synthase dehydratase domain-containing protein n=1 Tax=Saccharomonospora iraqiensis TaxID=52698 RepID=UPI00022DF168
ALTLAADDGVVLTGRLSTSTAPWLGDHVVGGRVVVPGTALLDLVLAAGRQTGVPHVDGLTLHEPLPVPATVQVSVGAGEDSRPVTVFARCDSPDEWVRHASGTLHAEPVEFEMAEWPAELEELALDGLHDRFAEGGINYGPAFRGLARAWRHGDEILAEASTDGDVRGFGVHPALLDSVLHALATADGSPALPFDWQGVTVHATDAHAVRARLTPAGPDAVRLVVTTPDGAPVLTAERLGFRPEDRTAPAEPLYRLEWAPVPSIGAIPVDLAGAHTDLPAPLTVRCPAGTTPADVLPLLQAWSNRADGLLTLAVHPDPGGLGAAGLTRTAAAEHPGRFAVVETPDSVLLPTSDEAWTRVSDGVLQAPRLVRVSAAGRGDPFPADATVLVTGGTGTLGAEVAKHLARRGVRSFVLASRRGPDAPGAADL